MGYHSQPTDKARDELYSHIIRCDVLEADMPTRMEWLEETMEYLGYRHPYLSPKQLKHLETLGRRFVRPAIPHGADSNHANREEWSELEADESAELVAA